MCFVIFSFRAQKLAEYDINLAKLMELASFNSECCIYICIIPTPPLFHNFVSCHVLIALAQALANLRGSCSINKFCRLLF